MTEAEALDLLARAAAANCYGQHALCTCGDITEAWRAVSQFLYDRARAMGLPIKNEEPLD